MNSFGPTEYRLRNAESDNSIYTLQFKYLTMPHLQASAVLAVLQGALLLSILCVYKYQEHHWSTKATPEISADISRSGYQAVPGAEGQIRKL